ncbi:MAG: hypothetical protein QM778_26665 [Myxococcales bacterium]
MPTCSSTNGQGSLSASSKQNQAGLAALLDVSAKTIPQDARVAREPVHALAHGVAATE